VLRGTNTGPWQQWIPQPNGTLKNVATGLYVSPNGTGAQLRGTTAPSPWGGSAYTWQDYAHLLTPIWRGWLQELPQACRHGVVPASCPVTSGPPVRDLGL